MIEVSSKVVQEEARFHPLPEEGADSLCTCTVRGTSSRVPWPWGGLRPGILGGTFAGTRGRQTHLPQQHRQQQEDEESHQQTDGDDPPHNVAAGLQIVQGLEDHLEGNTDMTL